MSHSPAPSTSPVMYTSANGDANMPSALPISVRIKRFATDDQGGQYELVERPHRMLELGMDVFLEMRFPGSPQFDRSFCLSVPTGVEGTIVSFRSLKYDAVELIIRNDEDSGRFHYLLVPFKEGYLSLPDAVLSGFSLLRPYLITQRMDDAGGDRNDDEERRDIQAYLAALAVCTATPQRCQQCDRVLHSPGLSNDSDGSEYARSPSSVLDDETSENGSEHNDTAVSQPWLSYVRSAMSIRSRLPTGSVQVVYDRGEEVVLSGSTFTNGDVPFDIDDIHPLVVRNVRPPYLSRGGRYEVVERPVWPITLGFRVTLQMRMDTPERPDIPSILFPVGIQGTIIGVEALRNDGIEFVIRNTGYRNSFEYLFVNHMSPGFVAFPSLFVLGYSLIRPYLVPVGLSEARDDMDAGGQGARMEEHWRTWLTKAHQSPDWLAQVPEPQPGEVLSLHLPRRYAQYSSEGFLQESQHATNLVNQVPSGLTGVAEASLNGLEADVLNLSPM
ncbi:hypothetical protein C8Q76DRAFT_690701 [Earliella scabrosa]|nr:hypothetical protein C8Q76DRAFT_690701 [Earliella scabrosa]